MDKIKPSEIIASRFGISQESAKFYLGRVQKSFKTEKPPHKLIVDFIESQEIEIQITPYEVAVMLNENNVWPHPLNSPPPIIVDDEDVT